MLAPEDHSGFFTPADLTEMQQKLDKNAPPRETEAERENRALGIVLGWKTRKPTNLKKKNRDAGTDRSVER